MANRWTTMDRRPPALRCRSGVPAPATWPLQPGRAAGRPNVPSRWLYRRASRHHTWVTDEEAEVQELTQLLRDDASFADLRRALVSRGMSPEHVLLAGLIGGEDCRSYGAFVDTDGDCTMFELADSGEVIRWERVAGPEALGHDFTAVATAVAMVSRKG